MSTPFSFLDGRGQPKYGLSLWAVRLLSWWAWTGATVLCLSSLGGAAKTQEDLDAAVASLETAVAQERTQDVQVINVINSLVAKPLTVIAGNAIAKPGDTVDIPIIFRSSTTAVSSMQFDLNFPLGMRITSVDAGPAATAAGKSVQFSVINSGSRVLAFGLNQTPIGTGTVAILHFAIDVSATPGTKIIQVLNLAGSTPAGTGVPLIGKSGSITIE